MLRYKRLIKYTVFVRNDKTNKVNFINISVLQIQYYVSPVYTDKRLTYGINNDNSKLLKNVYDLHSRNSLYTIRLIKRVRH